MAQVEIEILLKVVMGLDTASIGSAAIERAVALRMGRTGIDRPDDYLARIRASQDELQELIEAVVVPETWFFRHGESFEALERLVAGQWLPSHPMGTLHILSVPCSTGEEPYSIAMALLGLGLPGTRFSVDALDISGRVLEHARRGVYGKNSFRSPDLSFRDKFFNSTEGGYGIRREVRDQVTFRQGNILQLDTALNRFRYEIIFCRNLLIYFDRQTQDRILEILRQLLAPGGTMFMGPAEALVMRTAGFSPTSDPMAFAFREGGRTSKLPDFAPPPLKRLAPKPVFSPPPSPTLPVTKAISRAVPEPAPPRRPPAPANPEAELEACRILADSGQLDKALDECEAHRRRHGDTAGAFYLLGVIHDARGELPPAADNYRKALYLDPNHREALMHWALLAERQGDSATAQRLQARAKRLAEMAP